MALFFGVRDSIHCIGNLEMSGPNGESLCLAHKTTARFFIAGINLRDDGYVIGVVPRRGGDPSKYIRLSPEQIVAYQAQGALPTPLPPYSIPLTDYVWGYSLWIILAIAIPLAFFNTRHLSKR